MQAALDTQWPQTATGNPRPPGIGLALFATAAVLLVLFPKRI